MKKQIINACIVTMNSQMEVVKNGFIDIEGDEILRIGIYE